MCHDNYPPFNLPDHYAPWNIQGQPTQCGAENTWPRKHKAVQNITVQTKTTYTNRLCQRACVRWHTALVASSINDLQRVVDIFSEASKSYGLQTDLKKTEIMVHASSEVQPPVLINGSPLERVDELTGINAVMWWKPGQGTTKKNCKGILCLQMSQTVLLNNHHVTIWK